MNNIVKFTIFTKSKMPLASPPPPPNPNFCLTIVDFSWDDCNTQEKLERIGMQILGCIMVYVKMVNSSCMH